MIGFYDYTVILTYLSLMSSIAGMVCTFSGHAGWGIFCLGFSGLMDAFDGKVARTKKNRTKEEKMFGIQIDSLCDMVSFGVYPVIFCFATGMCDPLGIGILAFYCLAGLIRLAYYNVTEELRQQETTEARKYYQGLPITSIAVILPLVYGLSPLFEKYTFIVLYVVMFITALLFILNIKIKKISTKGLLFMIIAVGIVVLYIAINYRGKGLFRWNWRSLLIWTD